MFIATRTATRIKGLPPPPPPPPPPRCALSTAFRSYIVTFKHSLYSTASVSLRQPTSPSPSDSTSPDALSKHKVWVSGVPFLWRYLYGNQTRDYYHKILLEEDIAGAEVEFYREESGLIVYYKNKEDFSRLQSIFVAKDCTVYEIEGKPPRDDLRYPIPCKVLKITYDGKLDEDFLYRLFRKFGQITQIVVNPRNPSKASIFYDRTQSAILARNCLHNGVFNNSRMKVTYNRPTKGFYSLTLKRKVVMVAVVVAACLFIYLLIFLCRILFIMWTIYGDWKLVHLPHLDGDKMMDPDISEVLNKLNENPFILLSGESESGRTLFVRRLSDSQPHTVNLTCFNDKLLNMSTEAEDILIESMATSVGYKPSFKTVNEFVLSLKAYLGTPEDLLSSSKLAELENLLQTIKKVLKLPTFNNYVTHKLFPRFKKNNHKIILIFDRLNEFLDEIEYNTAKDDKNNQKRIQLLVRNLIRWCDEVSNKKKYCKIIFVGTGQTMGRLLKYAPKDSRAVYPYYIRDLTKAETKKVLKDPRKRQHKPFEFTDADFDVMWNIIGGRRGHLQAMKDAMVKKSNIAKEAESLLSRQIKQIQSEAFSNPNNKWTKVQFWDVIKLICESPNHLVPYAEILSACDGDPTVVEDILNRKYLTHHDKWDSSILTYNTPLQLNSYKEITSDVNMKKSIEKERPKMIRNAEMSIIQKLISQIK